MTHARATIPAAVFWLLAVASIPSAADPPPPANGPRLFAEGMTSFRSGDLVAAERSLRSALSAYPVTDAVGRTACLDYLVELEFRLERHDLVVGLARQLEDIALGRRDAGRMRTALYFRGRSLAVLGYNREARKDLKTAVAPGAAPLPASQQFIAACSLAQLAYAAGDQDEFQRRYAEVFQSSAMRLSKAATLEDRMNEAWGLADLAVVAGRPKEALAQLDSILPALREAKANDAVRETLRRLAVNHRTLGDVETAEKELRGALSIRPTVDSRSGEEREKLATSDLHAELAAVLDRKGDAAGALKERQTAIEGYSAVLKNKGKNDGADLLLAAQGFWSQLGLFRRSGAYRQALQLADANADIVTDFDWLAPTFDAERGSLQMRLGELAAARSRLTEAQAFLDRQTPKNLFYTTRILNALAVVSQASGDLDGAEKTARRTLDVYSGNDLPVDSLKVETFNLLGVIASTRGEYDSAVAWLRKGIDGCKVLGVSAAPARSHLHLNVALLLRSQGDVEAAAVECQTALDVRRSAPDGDALADAWFTSALASLYTTQGRPGKAEPYARETLDLCKRFQIKDGPLVATAEHCLAVHKLQSGDVDGAEPLLASTLAYYTKSKRVAGIARAHNWLGVVGELRGKRGEAEQHYRSAASSLDQVRLAPPSIQFISLWRLANVVRERGGNSDSRSLLAKSIDVVEAARTRTYGEGRQRALFFAQFASAFSQGVEWSLADGLPEDALVFAERGRARAYLDQLRQSGVDPLRASSGPEADALRTREADVRRRMQTVRAKAYASPAARTAAVSEMDGLQREYAEIWKEVVNLNPLYRHRIGAEQLRESLAAVRSRALGPKGVLLYYVVGRTRSWAFLASKDRVEAFPLEIAATSPSQESEPGARGAAAVLASRGETSRAIQRTKISATGAPLQAPLVKANGNVRTPLTAGALKNWVTAYSAWVVQPDRYRSRGIVREQRRSAEEPATEWTVLGDAVLPRPLRERLAELKPSRVVIAPDASLHKLPLEVLMLSDGGSTRFAADVLPATCYAQSAAALAALLNRPPATAKTSLLTLGDCAYPQAGLSSGFVGFTDPLPLLPATAEECRRVGGLFPSAATVLLGSKATEAEFRRNVGGRKFVHVAAHAFADDSFGNLFGAMALTPPAKPTTSQDDGFLSLNEIYGLPLAGCELAVLSACETNVGPQLPLEAGVTLASGFLAAGARRVVASLWEVPDESTAALMAGFFERVAAADAKGSAIDFAQALYEARKVVRQNPKWQAPYFWAPFELLGPADADASR